MKIVAHLQEGRRYTFPQYLIDILGYDSTVAIVHSLPQPQPSPFPLVKASVVPALLNLGHDHPFRATVLDQGLGEKGYSIILQAADSGLLHVAGTFDHEITRRIALHLKRGETFEFPAVLDDALLSDAGRQTKAQPKTDEARVLSRYIGEWTGTLESDPLANIVMKCHWKADGSGIWREITFSRKDDDSPPSLDIALITHDDSLKHYLSVDPAKPDAPPIHITWKAAEKSFITTLPASPGQTRVNTATFISDDRIDWQTATVDAQGKSIATKRGSYKRTTRLASSQRLPSSTLSTTVTPGTSIVTTISGATPGTPGLQVSTFTSSGFTPPTAPSSQSQFSTFLQLRELPPFRGKITALNIAPDTVTTTIECGDDRKYLIHHRRDEDWDTHLKIAKRLKYEETFEFPDVLAAEYTAPTGDVKPSEAMRALAAFLGEWRVVWDSGPMKDTATKGIVRYFWKNDGKGLWREFATPATTEERNGYKIPHPARTMTYLITYDEAKGHYLEHTSSPNARPTHYTATWDASGQVLTQKAESSYPEPGTQVVGIRRFVTPDRIDYTVKQTKADGSFLSEASGRYERVKE